MWNVAPAPARGRWRRASAPAPCPRRVSRPQAGRRAPRRRKASLGSSIQLQGVEHERGYLIVVLEAKLRQAGLNGRVGGHRHDMLVLWMQQRVTAGRAKDLQLGQG